MDDNFNPEQNNTPTPEEPKQETEKENTDNIPQPNINETTEPAPEQPPVPPQPPVQPNGEYHYSGNQINSDIPNDERQAPPPPPYNAPNQGDYPPPPPPYGDNQTPPPPPPPYGNNQTPPPPYGDNQTPPPPPPYYGEQKHYVPTGFRNEVNRRAAFSGKPPKTPNGSNKNGIRIFAVVLAVVLVLAVAIGVNVITNPSTDNKTTSEKSDSGLLYSGEDVVINQGATVDSGDIEPDADGKYTADEVSEIVGKSVVNIQVYSKDSTSGSIASGVILSDKGYIVTNDHIYSEIPNAKFVVTTNDGTSYKASYVAGDQRSDIAVLKFDETPKNLTAAVFADSSAIKSGDEVIAIGSPYGLSGTVTKGIVSSPARRISFSSTSDDGTTSTYSMQVIQTDTALNSGNSGGALVNMYGQVVGISSSKIVLSGYEGLCFAIPSNNAIKYAKSLIKTGKVAERAKLGITYTSITSASSLVNEIPSGLKIQSIDNDSDLYNKGIAVGDQGDIITEIEGKAITTADEALDIIDSSAAGDTLKLKIYITATGKYKSYNVKLLEDSSVSSYTTEIPKSTQPSTSSGNYYYGGGSGSNGSGSGSGSGGVFGFGN